MLVFPTNTVGIYTGKTVNHWVGGLEWVAEHLPSKLGALSSNLSTTKHWQDSEPQPNLTTYRN
jgi:primosomal protein N''